MEWLGELWRRLVFFLRRGQFHRDLEEEMRLHQELRAQTHAEDGMVPEEAHYAAQREFGNPLLLRERSRDMWGFAWLETLIQDLRYGLRQLRRNPGFTAVAVITLALGIGANTAIFSIVNAALLHPLPFHDADRLVTRWGTIPHFNYTGLMAICGPDYAAWRDQNHVFEGIAALSGQTSNLTGAGEPVRLGGSQVTAGFFPLLGIAPTLGRTFQPDEDRPGNAHEVLLSDKLWRSRFGSDPAISGKSIKLDGEFYTVVGVMPAGFDFPNEAEFWTPVPLTDDCSNATMQLVARLKPSVTLDQARSDVALIDGRLDRARHHGRGIQVSLVPLTQAMGYGLRGELLVLLGAVGLLLLIACANVANLFLARGATRQHEMAVRSALGASRRRIIAQMLTESLLLAAFGGALGLGVAAFGHWFLAFSFALLPSSFYSMSVATRVASLGIDRWVLGFALGVTLLAGMIFGLAPGIRASKPDLRETLQECGRSLSASRGRVRDAFVVAEIALSLVLLVGAGLFLRTLVRLMSVDRGFSAEKVLTMTVDLPESRYHTENQMIAFEQRVLHRLHGLPGVLSGGGVFGLPLGAERIYGDITIEGQPTPPHGAVAAKVVVTGDYFRSLGIPVIRGRLFGVDDTEGAPRVAIINQSLARYFWPHASAIGQHLKPGFSHDSWYRIVGVVGDVKMAGLGEESPLALYLPYDQAPALFLMRDLTLVVRTASTSASIVTAARHAIEAADPELPVFDVATMEQLVYRSASEPRFVALLLGIFAALALGLASVGIYGVMSYAVAQHTREIGIRMALGAQKRDVLHLVLGQGMILTFIGVGIGIVGALGLTRFLSSLLYGVKPTDPLTFVGVSALLSGVALLACYIPARRATKVDPMVALRHD